MGVISRDLEKVSGQAVATAAAQPKTKKIATGVVGRTGQQIAEVHEQEMLERDLNKVSGESVHVAAGVSTKAHVPTGKIDQATRQVGEVVETKTKERDVETLMGAPPLLSTTRLMSRVWTLVSSLLVPRRSAKLWGPTLLLATSIVLTI